MADHFSVPLPISTIINNTITPSGVVTVAGIHVLFENCTMLFNKQKFEPRKCWKTTRKIRKARGFRPPGQPLLYPLHVILDENRLCAAHIEQHNLSGGCTDG